MDLNAKMSKSVDKAKGLQQQVEDALQNSDLPTRRTLSRFERVITTNGPILESLLLQIPTDTIIKLYHTSHHLREFLRLYPTAWRHLSFRLLVPSGTPAANRIVVPGMPDPETQRQSRPYALDQLLMNVVIPFSSCLKSLELDNTAVSGQILISTVLHARRESLVHLSVRGCKNVSLKYHIIPYLTMFGLQYDVDIETNPGASAKPKLALKSLYAYRCRHHRRRPYLSASLLRKDSDSEPTHELVNLCHKLGIWTDTAWCTTPAGRCFRRRGYVSMRVPQGSPEVWVVFDRLWRCKNWIGPIDASADRPQMRDGKLWENCDSGCYGEPVGTGDGPGPGEGKMIPAHLRHSHTQFIQNVKCDACREPISERCEQCSILMHCVGCRRTLCASCAYERPYLHRGSTAASSGSTHGSSHATSTANPLWWAPGALHSPSSMQDPVANPMDQTPLFQATAPPTAHPALKFHWCCTEPIFSGGGGISIGTPSRDVDQVRAVPLPRGQGWEDLEYTVSEWSKTFPKFAYGDPLRPDYSLETGHLAMMKWLLGPPSRQVSPCPRNLCQECYDSPQWKVHCKSCSKPLCIEHDLRGLRLRICGYRDLALEKMTMQTRSAVNPGSPPDDTVFGQLPEYDLPFRNQRIIDSTNSSFIEDPPGDGIPDDNTSDIPNGEPSLFARNTTRSFSAPPSNHSGSSSPTSSLDESQLEAPRWQGCQSFFCPPYRSIGDQRQRCPSHLRECKACAVNVCQDCVQANPPCKCSYCEENYLCPNCMKVRARDGTCRRRQEEKARRERKWKKDMQVLEGILELKVANEIAENAGEFLTMAEGVFQSETPSDLIEGDLITAADDEDNLPGSSSLSRALGSMANSGSNLLNDAPDSYAGTQYMDSFEFD